MYVYVCLFVCVCVCVCVPDAHVQSREQSQLRARHGVEAASACESCWRMQAR